MLDMMRYYMSYPKFWIEDTVPWLPTVLQGVFSIIPVIFFIMAFTFIKMYNNENTEYVRGFFYLTLLLGGTLWIINIQ